MISMARARLCRRTRGDLMKVFAYRIALAGLVLVTRSAAADSSLDRVRACMPQQNDAARLACYDKELGRTATPAVTTTTPTAPLAATAAPAVAAPPAAIAPPAAAAPPATTALPAATASPAVTAPPTAAAAATPSKSADFGMTPELLHKQQAQAGIKPVPPPQSMSAQVAKIGTYGNGLLLVTLDNGQVWSQQDSGDAQLAVGDAVKISRGMFGALYLDAPSHRRTRVKRIQ